MEDESLARDLGPLLRGLWPHGALRSLRSYKGCASGGRVVMRSGHVSVGESGGRHSAGRAVTLAVRGGGGEEGREGEALMRLLGER